MSNLDKLADKLVKYMKDPTTKPKPKGYDTPAEVKRVEGDTLWVKIPGGVDETPVKKTINASEGDEIQIRVSNGRAWATGNSTAPPTDDTLAESAKEVAMSANDYAIAANKAASIAQESADNAQSSASAAQTSASNALTAANNAQSSASAAQTSASNALTAANNAQSSASAAQASANNANEYAARALGNLSTVQSVAETLSWITAHGTMSLTSDTTINPAHVYFVMDEDEHGEYIVGNHTYNVVTEPDEDDLSTYYELTIDESLNNYVGTHLALTSEGLWLLPETSGTNKILIATGGQGHTYSDAGTYIINSNGDVVAKFGENVVIGKDDRTQSYLELNFNSITFHDKERSEFFKVEDLRNENGYAKLSETFSQSQVGNESFTVNYTPMSISTTTVKVDNVIVSIDRISSKTVILVEAPPLGSSVSIEYRCADDNLKAYTLGIRPVGSVKGPYSLVEGYNNVASGIRSHAEGEYTEALGYVSHAEGVETTVSGNISHAEGLGSQASGSLSHAEGEYTEALGYVSHAEGYHTKASGNNTHAEGYYTEANGEYSHAGGYYTRAEGDLEYVIGKYNIPTIATSKRIGYYMCTTNNYDDESIYIPFSNSFDVNDLDVYFNEINISNRQFVQLSDNGVTIYRQAAPGERFEDGDEIEVYNSNYFPNAFVIGNGEDNDHRSNGLTVDWDGRINCGDYSGNFRSIFDIFYPVGSYYETSDSTFDPNIAWGGTWELESAGKFHVSAGTGYALGSTGGEPTHTLTLDEIPSHDGHLPANSGIPYGYGTTGKYLTGASLATYGTTGRGWNINSNEAFPAGISRGGGQAHNNMPPYVAVNRWHRTA